MKRSCLALCLLFAAAQSAWPDPPKVQERLTIAVGDDGQVVVRYEPGKKLLVVPGFDAKDCTFFRGYEAQAGEASFYVRPKSAGPFRVSFVVVGDDQYSTLVVETIGTPPPQPPPQPPPNPPPKPGPVLVDKVWVIVVEETGERTPAAAKVLTDLAYWKGLTARGHSWRHYDKDSPDASRLKYPQLAAQNNVPLPALLLLDATGKKLKAVPLPTSTAGIDAAIKEVSVK